MILRAKLILIFIVVSIADIYGQGKMLNLNAPEREKYFTELGFGMFIHWSVDVQYGYNISHSMRLASDDYLSRYISELPKTFNPEEFDPVEWAKLAKMTGMKYVVFTAKHHNGFCMWDTKTTDFSIMNTPFERDVVKEVVEAFRHEGIAIGLYYSPDDFWFLHNQGYPVTRYNETSFASNNKELKDYSKTQLNELLTEYGEIDILFLDGNEQFGKTELAKLAWELNPEIVVTRGAMNTPEQELPNIPIPSPWEACFTLTESWSYRPTNEVYKSASEIILKWVDIKAKGGNFLLNVGPDPKGKIPEAQSDILNEVGAWWFINYELFESTKPYKRVTSDAGYYLLQSVDEKDLYIVVPGPVERNTWQEIAIENLRVSNKTKVSLLGQSDFTDEKELQQSKRMSVRTKESTTFIEYVFLQNLYNVFRVENKWVNPVVLKLTDYKI